jgi:hypothetical protein
MPSKLQILKTENRKNARQTEMTTYLYYTNILLYNDHFLSQIFRVKASKTELHFHHNFRLLFVVYVWYPIVLYQYHYTTYEYVSIRTQLHLVTFAMDVMCHVTVDFKKYFISWILMLDFICISYHLDQN